jgi:outer membrane lipoprotein-sorting protein
MGTARLAIAAVMLISGSAVFGSPVLAPVLASTFDSIPLPRPSPFKMAAPASIPTRPVTDPQMQRALIERASASLSNFQTLVGEFVQIGPDGRRTDGQFYIQKPGRVRFEYNPPSPIDVIADGQSVVVRNRLLATQDPYPLSQTPLRLLLSDRLDLAKETDLVSVLADDQLIALVIEERHALIGMHRMKLVFGAKDFQLRQWIVTDPQGYDTAVSVYNLDANKKLDPSLFKITYERSMQ